MLTIQGNCLIRKDLMQAGLVDTSSVLMLSHATSSTRSGAEERFVDCTAMFVHFHLQLIFQKHGDSSN